MKRLWIPLTILLLCSLLVIGCGSSTSPAPATSSAPPPPAKTATAAPAVSTPANTTPLAAKQTTPTPKYGGALKLIAVGSAVNLGVPWQPRAISDVLMRLPCVETLMRVDDVGLPAPGLFSFWQVSPDMKSITFKIQQGVKFHDGTDLNAD